MCLNKRSRHTIKDDRTTFQMYLEKPILAVSSMCLNEMRIDCKLMCMLYVVEICQILHTILLFDPSYGYILRYGLKFFSFHGWIEEFPSTQLLFLILCKQLSKGGTALSSVTLTLIPIAYNKFGKMPRTWTNFRKYFVKLLGFIFLLFKSVLASQMVILGVVCVRDQATNAMLYLGSICIILGIVFQTILSLLFTSYSPFHQFAGSAFRPHQEIIKNIAKVILAGLFSISTGRNSINKVSLLGLALAVSFIWCLLTIRMPDSLPYRKMLRYFVLVLPCTCLWLVLVMLLHQNYCDNQQGFYYGLLGWPIVLWLWFLLVESSKKNHKNNNFLTMIQNIENVEFETSKRFLVIHLFNHQKECQQTTCLCYELKKDLDNKSKWYKYLTGLISKTRQNTDNEFYIVSLINLYRLGNPYRAAHQLFQIKNRTISLEMQKQLLYQDIYMKIHDSLDVSYLTLLSFNRKFSQFKELIQESCKKHKQFWDQLQKKRTNGTNLLIFCQQINETLMELNKIFNTAWDEMKNLELAMQFKQFLQDIRQDVNPGLEQKIKEINLQIIKQRKSDKFLNKATKSKDQTGIIVVNCENRLGIISYCNLAISEIFGFSPIWLQGKSINCLIPEELKEFHNLKLKQFIEGQANYAKLGTKSVFALDKDSNIVYISTNIKVLADISQGLNVVTFIETLPISKYFIVCKQNGDVLGTSSSFNKQFGLENNIQHYFDGISIDVLRSGSVTRVNKINKKTATSRQMQSQNSLEISILTEKHLTQGYSLFLIVLTESSDQDAALKLISTSTCQQDTIPQSSEPDQSNNEVDMIEESYKKIKNSICSGSQPNKLRALAGFGYVMLVIVVLLSFCILPLLFQRFSLVRLQAETIRINHDLKEQMLDTELVLRHTNKKIRASLPYAQTFSRFNETLQKNKNTLVKYFENLDHLGKLDIFYRRNLSFWHVDPQKPYFRKTTMSETGAILQFMTACSNLQNISAEELDFFIILDMLNGTLNRVTRDFMSLRYNLLYSIIPGMQTQMDSVFPQFQCHILTCNPYHLYILCIVTVLSSIISISGIVLDFNINKVVNETMQLLKFLTLETVQCNIINIEAYEKENLQSLNSQQPTIIQEQDRTKKQLVCKKATTRKTRTSIQQSFSQATSCISPSSRDSTRIQPTETPLTNRNRQRLKSAQIKYEEQTIVVSRNQLWFIARYMLIAILPTVFFTVVFILIKTSLTNLIHSNNTYKNAATRSLYIYNIRFYTQQAMFDTVRFPDLPLLIEYSKSYINDLYQVDRAITTGKPNNTYEQYLKNNEKANICNLIENYRQYSWRSLSKQECENMHSNVLANGIKSSFIALADTAQGLYLQAFDMIVEKQITDLMAKKRYQEMQGITLYLRAFIKYELELYIQFLEKQLHSLKSIFVAICFLFAILSLLSGFFVWRLLIRQLFNQVNVIKGIVLLITFKKIEKNRRLKEQLVNCQVISAFQ